MALFIASQKNIPPDVAIHARAIDLDPAGLIQAKPEPPIEDTDLGAAAALVRLQREEIMAHRRAALAREGGNPIEARLAYAHWTKMLEAEIKYEKIVTDEARRTNALISRAEVEEGLRWLAYGARVTSEGMLPSLVPLIQGEPDPIRARQVMRRCLWHVVTAAEGFAILAKVPAWMLECFSKDFQSYLGGNQMESITQAAEALRQLAAELPGIANDQTPKSLPEGSATEVATETQARELAKVTQAPEQS